MQKISLSNLKIMIDTIKKHWPNKDNSFYKIALSIELLRIFIGNDWVNMVIFDKNIHRKHLDARNFMKSSFNGLQWQERVRRLAERIYNLQDINNIEDIIKEINNGHLESRFAEIEGATHLYRSNTPFEFVIPTGKLGESFDIKLLTNPPINCEVKHKLERIERSKKTIIKSVKKTLKRMREQVPNNEPSLFIIKIPEQWDKQDSSIIDLLNNFLENDESKNVIGIIFRWEERNINNEGMFYWKYFLKKNENFSLDKNGIEEILNNLNHTSSENWVNFDLIID